MSLFSLCDMSLNLLFYFILIKKWPPWRGKQAYVTALFQDSLRRSASPWEVGSTPLKGSSWPLHSSSSDLLTRLQSPASFWTLPGHANQRHKGRTLPFHGVPLVSGPRRAARAARERRAQKGAALTRVTNAVNTRSILMLSSSLDVFKQILIICSVQRPEIYCLIVLQRKLI